MIDNKTKKPQMSANNHIMTEHTLSAEEGKPVDVSCNETAITEEALDDPEDFSYSSMSR